MKLTEATDFIEKISSEYRQVLELTMPDTDREVTYIRIRIDTETSDGGTSGIDSHRGQKMSAVTRRKLQQEADRKFAGF